MSHIDILLKDIRQIERSARLAVANRNVNSAVQHLNDLENKVIETRHAVHYAFRNVDLLK